GLVVPGHPGVRDPVPGLDRPARRAPRDQDGLSRGVLRRHRFHHRHPRDARPQRLPRGHQWPDVVRSAGVLRARRLPRGLVHGALGPAPPAGARPRGGRRGGRRPPGGLPRAARARTLSRHRHLRIRRDRAARVPQRPLHEADRRSRGGAERLRGLPPRPLHLRSWNYPARVPRDHPARPGRRRDPFLLPRALEARRQAPRGRGGRGRGVDDRDQCHPGEGLRLHRRGGGSRARGRALHPLLELHRPRHGGAAAGHRLRDLSDLRRPRELRGPAPRGGGARGPHGEPAHAARGARVHLRRPHHPHHALPSAWDRGRGARAQGQGMAPAARGAPPGPGPVSDTPLLAIRNLSLHFGGLRALDRVSLDVPSGTIFALIGPNGSGKTTLFNVVTGALAPTTGTIRFQDEPIAGAKTHEIVRRGIARTFQNIRLFTRMSVFDNVWVALRHTPRGRDGTRSEAERVEALLELAGLAPKRDELVENLNFGERRRLEMARALATDPVLLLLDEPAAGMGQLELERLNQDIRRLRELGKTIFLIEHTMDLVMGVADRIAVLNFGEKIAEAAPAEIQANPRVIEAYLGRERPGA